LELRFESKRRNFIPDEFYPSKTLFSFLSTFLLQFTDAFINPSKKQDHFFVLDMGNLQFLQEVNLPKHFKSGNLFLNILQKE